MNIFEVQIVRRILYTGSIGGSLYARGEFVCFTLELPWRWNANDVSCIPNGRYSAIVRYDHHDKWRLELQGVPARSNIQIHIGNRPAEDSKGCILVGTAQAPNVALHSAAAYAKLKAAFYGDPTMAASPAQKIWVTFTGVIGMTPGENWGRNGNVA